MMSEKDFGEMLQRYLNGNASTQEIAQIEKWYASLDQCNNNPNLNEKQLSFISYLSFRKILQRIKLEKRLSFWPPALAAAAMIIVTLLFYSIVGDPLHLSRDITSMPGAEQLIVNQTLLVKEVILADSTKVMLQPNSSIQIDTDFNVTERRVFLIGEAFFKVNHNASKPFYVDTHEVITKVLGTSFSVKAYKPDKNITVKVKTGTVSVYAGKSKKENGYGRKIILSANQQAVYNLDEDKNQFIKEIVADPEKLIPMQGLKHMKFESAPLAEVMTALEKIYGIEIIYAEDKFSACKLTTTLAGDGIFNRLDIICKAIGASYSQENGRIIITGAGCTNLTKH